MEKRPGSKHLILSGGSRGLGLALLNKLLDEGYQVSTFARSMTPSLQDCLNAFPDSCRGESLDIQDAEGLRRFCQESVSRFGEIYGVINNSAIAIDGVLATLPEIEIARMLSVNLEGVIRLTRLAVRSMLKANQGGRILNISSIIGTRGYNGLAVYSATKAGLDGFTRSLARELGRMQISVNSIAPGYFPTDMSGTLSSSQMGQIVRRTPMNRLARFEDIAPLALFLLSPSAEFITGQTILVDGGISC